MRYCRNSRKTPAPGRTIAYGDFSESGGVAAMKTLLERDTDLDAVFAASDLMAGRMAELLIAPIGRGPVADSHVLLDTRLVRRASA